MKPKIKFETKIVEHEGKKIKMPFDCQIYPDKQVTVANRFTGQETTMPGFAASVYDVIIGAEMIQDWDTVRLGLDWFRKHFAEQYMVVLD
jgi:hypothetical protein